MDKHNRCLLKMYLNARHFEQEDSIHPHTWEISLLIQGLGQSSQVEQIRKIVETYLEQYEGKTINDFFPFNILPPSTENIGKVLYKELSKTLQQKGMVLESLQISDNPTKIFILNEYQTYYQDLRKKVEEDFWRFQSQKTGDVLAISDVQKPETRVSSMSKEKSSDTSFMLLERKRTFQRKKEQRRKRLRKIIIGFVLCLVVCTAGVVLVL